MSKTKGTQISELGEFGLIERLTRTLPKHNATTLRAAGDDAAVIDLGDEALLLSTDMLTERNRFCGNILLGYISEQNRHLSSWGF